MGYARESSNLSIPTIPLLRAIGAVGARLVHTEEVTGSNPVSPICLLLSGRSSVVEHLLPKQKVASSNLVARSISKGECSLPGRAPCLFRAKREAA